MKEKEPEIHYYSQYPMMRGILRSTGALNKRTQFCVIIFLIIILSVIWFLNSHARLLLLIKKYNEISYNKKTQHIEQFTSVLSNFNKYKESCYGGKEPETIEDLITFVKLLENNENRFCRDQHQMFINIYQIRIKYTSISISPAFMLKVKKWLNNDPILIEAARNQSLIFVDNLYSQESVVFNPVRANRPGGAGSGDAKKYVDDVVLETSKDCDFCRYKNFTAADSFGHMQSKRSVIISNTFKIERYHGMVLFRLHGPIHFDQMQYIDSINLALKWFKRTHELVPSHNYRFMYCDVLPKASASQVHPHIHLTLGDYAYYAKWNILYKAGLVFSMHHDRKNYWKNVLQLHRSLGLTVSFGQASVMAYLTPQKDYEVIVIAKKPCLDFFRLVFFTIRTFMDDLEQYSLSMGYVFPKIGTDYNYGDELPMMVRIVSRGAANQARSDTSSFDLFGTSNVNKDPFKVIKLIRSAVAIKQKEKFSFPEWNADYE